MASTEERARERDLERFLTFVDAVVAIAITLLVLPLVDVAADVGHGSVADVLGDHANQFGSAVLSFVVIAQLWLAQHRTLRIVVVQDPVITRLMLLWLLMIVALPFPSALLGDAGDQALTKVLYIGTMAVASLSVAAMARRIRRVPEIREGDLGHEGVGALTTGVTLLLALALSLAIPAASYWPLLLLLVTDRIGERVFGHLARR